MTDLSLVAVLITTAASAAIGIISQIQHSRCTELNLFWGLCACTRKVPDVEEEEVDLNNIELKTQ
jgi:hypothetical protein